MTFLYYLTIIRCSTHDLSLKSIVNFSQRFRSSAYLLSILFLPLLVVLAGCNDSDSHSSEESTSAGTYGGDGDGQ